LIYVGIDFSIVSTALCIEHDAVEHFYSLYRNEYPKKRLDIMEPYMNLHRLSDSNTFNDKGIETNIRENQKIDCAIEVSEKIVEILTHFNEPFVIGIETFSYGSLGNVMFDLVGFQYVLRSYLKKMDLLEKIYFIAPPEVKRHANTKRTKSVKKKDMVDFYKELEVDNSLTKLLDDVRLKGYPKPIDDLVDSWYLKEILKNKVLNDLSSKGGEVL
jgi:hypothetical protein